MRKMMGDGGLASLSIWDAIKNRVAGLLQSHMPILHGLQCVFAAAAADLCL